MVASKPIDFAEPIAFARRFVEIVGKPPALRNAEYTTWFGERMHVLAASVGCECQNLQLALPGRPGEWLKLDHVFVRNRHYDAFPVIVVEHENGEMSFDAKSRPSA